MDGLGPIGIDVRENNRNPDEDVDGNQGMSGSMSFGSALAKYKQAEPHGTFGADQSEPASTARWLGPSVGKISGNSRQRIEMAIKAAKAVYGNDTVMVRLAVSQAILESGAGLNSGLAIEGNNFFGIKGRGNAGTINFDTSEVFNGRTSRINAGFAKNDTPEASFLQHHDLMNRPRYASVLAAAAAGDFEGAATAVRQSGYATDPGYTAKLIDINRRLVDPLLNAPAEQLVSDKDVPNGNRASLRVQTTSLTLSGNPLPQATILASGTVTAANASIAPAKVAAAAPTPLSAGNRFAGLSDAPTPNQVS